MASKPAHRRGTYQVASRQIRQAANANPLAICWRDGFTLAQHTGDGLTWTAGHTIPGSPHARPWLEVTRRPPPGDWLAPEVSSCNYSAGARQVNESKANPRSRRWLT